MIKILAMKLNKIKVIYIETITHPNRIAHFTDGSVDPITQTAGASFTARDISSSIRLTDNASSQQAEAVAMAGA